MCALPVGAGGVKSYDGLKLMTFDFIISLTFGRDYTREEILALSQQYQQWTGGFLAWPWLKIPFTPFAGAMRARQAMVNQFQQATEDARQKLAAGQFVPGIIGSLVAAVDEHDNRWADPGSSGGVTPCLQPLQKVACCCRALQQLSQHACQACQH